MAVSPYIKSIFTLLVFSYLADQLNQMYRLNIFTYKNIVSKSFQDLIECLTELSLSFYAMYILFTHNISSTGVYLFLIFYSLFYLGNGILSAVLVLDKNNKHIHSLNEEVFHCEFVLTKVFTITLFYVLYNTFF